MTPVLLALLMGGQPAQPTRLAAAAALPKDAAATEVERLVSERLHAAVKGDKATWRRHIADECLWIGPGLVVGTTADAGQEISANANLPAKNYELRDFEARVFGDVVVATYLSIEHQYGKEGLAKRFRKTDTYLRRGGRWQLISATEIYVPRRLAHAVSPSTYDSYVGEYTLDPSHVVRVWRAGERLLSQSTGERHPIEFLAAREDVFFVDGEPGEWVFERAADGKVRGLIFKLGAGDDVVLRKTR